MPIFLARPRFRRLAGLFAWFLILAAHPAWAAPGYENTATCRLRIAAVDTAALALDPSPLLREYPEGGERMAWRVRVVATGGRNGLRALARAVTMAGGAQKAALGEGLARAAAACDDRDGAVTTEIADLVRAAGDGDVTRAFIQYLTRGADARVAKSTTLASTRPASPPLAGNIDDAARYFAPSLDAALRTPSP